MYRPRIRKAWLATVEGTLGSSPIYAPHRSRAMSELYYQLGDVFGWTFKEVLAKARVHRAPWLDQTLKARHPLTDHLTPEILHCVVHAYGGTGLKAGYRDHFYTSDQDPVMKAAYYHGLFTMYRVDKRLACDRVSIMYELTDLGKNVAAGEAQHYPSN